MRFLFVLLFVVFVVSVLSVPFPQISVSSSSRTNNRAPDIENNIARKGQISPAADALRPLHCGVKMKRQLCQKHKASAAANALYRLFLAALYHADLRRRSQYDIHKIHADAENENPDIAHDEVIKRQHAARYN